MFSDPQQGHEYSRFFGIYVEIFQMWTSRQQNEVLNIVQAKKYPEVPTFWRLFYRPKMAEISNLLSHFNAMCHNIWVKSAEGYNLLGAFESALCWSNHFVFSKWLFLKSISVHQVSHCLPFFGGQNIPALRQTWGTCSRNLFYTTTWKVSAIWLV